MKQKDNLVLWAKKRERYFSGFTLNEDKSKQHRSLRYAVMLLCTLILGIGNAWAGGGSSNYYASLKITQSGPTGAGSVYVANSNSKPGTANPGTVVKSAATTTSGGNVTMYWWVDINPGYNVSLSGKVSGGPYSAASASGNVSCAASTSADGTQAYTATATFVAVTVNSVDAASKNLAPTNPSIDYPFTVTFATSNLKTIALDLNKSPETADGKFTITSWAQDGNNVIATGKFNGGDSYGGASRNNSTTVSLQSKASGSTAKTCTVTANFPAMAFVSVEADDVFATQGESGKTGSATFKYNYAAEDDFPTTPTLTPTSGTGAFTVTGYTVTPDFAKGETTVTVNYSFDTNNGIGETPATLTLTAANGDVRTVTVTGHSEAMATNDASVTTTANVTTEYATFAQALAAANATSGATLTLLRNVDLGTITATNNITKAMTIDLNGKELRAAVNATSVGILTITKAVAVTIKDSKTGGKIINEIARNSEIRTIFVNAAGASLTLESGTLAVNNLGQYASKAATVNGVAVAKYSGCTSRVIHQVAGSTVNINGGKLDAKGTRSVYGIVQGSSASTNKAGTTVLNVTGGEIAVEAPYNALGIYAYGKVNMSAGVINTHITTDLIDAGYAADNGKNTNNGYGYGILMKVSVSATASSCYYGTLNMTGGTINVISDRKKAESLYNYGIYLEAAATGVGAGKTATDGTLSQKASAKASIENANITVHSNTYYSYGIIVYGSYNSYDNEYFTVPIKNCNIDVQAYLYTYAICANAAVNSTYGGCYWGDVELTGNTVTAESVTTHTAHAVLVVATTAHIFKDANTTTAPIYFGEYAAAAKAVINSGTYTAKTKTTTAYAVCSSTRAKTIYDPETQVQTNRKPGGNAEAYPIVIIHGGTFRGEATTTTSRAVSSGGYTTIDGGTFEAFSTSTTAYGLYAVSGKLTASGVTISASATGTAYGAYADCVVPTDNTAQTGFAYAAEMELNNCDITATTRTSTEARGVVVNAKNKMHNWKQFQADSTSYKWATTTYNAYKSVFPCTVAGHDSVGVAIAAKATINGCDIKVTAGTTTAYGVYSTATSVPASADSVASPVVNIKNSKFTVKTDASTGSTTAIGVYAGGPTTIDGCDFTVQPKTTTAKGVHAYDKKTTITNTKFDVKATSEARLFYAEAAIGSTTGWDYHGEFELGEGNECVATATGGNTAHILTLLATKRNIASGKFTGDYANATSALVTGGLYKATATGTTCYAVNLSAEQVQGAVKAAPSCTIENGKFWAKADGGTTGICSTNGVVGNILFKGGVYNVNTTLSKHIPEGYEEVPLASDRPEYTEGYRYEVGEAGMHGIDVCQIGSTKYKTLEEALQVVTSGQTIYMIANYIMNTPGDYILPSGATLLMPYKDGQKTIDTHPTRVYNSYTAPVPYKKLTLGTGVNLDVLGTIQAGGMMSAKGQTDGYNGMPTDAYGWLYLSEGSTITLENGAKLYAWGYVTGKGEIDAKSGSTVYEMFQVKDWRGGSCTLSMYNNSQKVFPLNQYAVQNIECPIKFRPGSAEMCDGTVNASSAARTFNDVKFIGAKNSGAMFEMDANDVSANTWVRKWYDVENDKQVYEANSSVNMNSITLSLNGYSFSSSNYVLPITNNMKIHLLSGNLYITQNTELLPGAEIEIDKMATAYINSGKSLYVFDIDEWNAFTGTTHTYTLPFSPSWTNGCPRSRTITKDAAVNVHGTFVVNGSLYTTAGGANIFSTNEDAGTITYASTVSSSQSSVYVANNTGPTYTERKSNPAWLKNGDGTYAYTSGTVGGKSWAYSNDQWQCWSKDGCFFMDAQDKPHAKPAAYVELTSKTPDANKLHHDAATGTRNFVWDENCYWWEVVTEPTAEGYYRSINADNNGKYNYYYYDSSAACWKIKKITITWNVNGTNTNYSVGYGTKPEWLGATPTKASSSSNYVWRWDGWTKGSDATVLANNDLPYVTENTTFTAHFYEKYYEYNITFKNSDGTVLDSRNWRAGTTPSYEGTPTKNPTVDYTYEFNGTWSPAITTVSGSATYTAQYTATPRAYTITFLNYDMSELGTAEVVYNGTPTNDTYLAAVAPLTEDPYKPDNSAFSFEFAGWRLQGASSNGFAQVKGDQSYIAQFNQTTKKYRIEFMDEDGETLLHWTQLEYGQTPSYTWDNPANKQDVEWNYTFSGWTPEFTEVQGAQTYTAVYNKTKRKYDITWKDGNGNTLKTDQVAYGETPEYCGATPTKTATAQYTYTFNNTWSPAITAVTGEATYTAQFGSTVNEYTITWVDGNGETLKSEQVAYGQTPAYTGATPTKTATAQYTYTFNNTWSPAITAVTGEATYTAQFGSTVNEYTITWVDGNGETLKTEQVAYGQTPAYTGATPTKTATDQYTYTFNNTWSPAITSVTGDATYTAQFGSTVNEYTITWVDGNGETLKSEQVAYGQTPAYTGATPTKTATAQYTYTFNNTWSPAITAVTGEATYTAQFGSTVNEYTITWVDGNGETLKTEQVAYGQTPAYTGATPTKTATEQYTYTFSGWEPELEPVTAAKEYTAKFTQHYREYNITLHVNGGTINSGNVEKYTYGTGATLPTDVTREGYTFGGWFDNSGLTGDAITSISNTTTGDKTYWAKWTMSEYHITWLNWDGSQLEEPSIVTTIQYDGIPAYPTTASTPTRATSEGMTYEWDGWSDAPGGAKLESLPAVTENTTYYAHFRITAIEVASKENIVIDDNPTVSTTKVRVSGRLRVNSGATLTTDDLILEGTLNTSGEIENNGTVTATNVYYDLSNGTEGFKARTWYAIAVPWQVDVPAYNQAGCGVYLTNDGENFTQQNLGASFDLLYYDGAYRAQNGPSSKCWKLVEKDAAANHIIFPGRAYMIYLTSNAKTIRFKKRAEAALFTNQTHVQPYVQQTGNDKDANWNGIANPATFHAYLNTASSNKGQVYIAGEDRYEAITNMNTNPLVVGQPVFVQATDEKTVVACATKEEYASHAPRRMSSSNEEKIMAEVRIAQVDKAYTDRLYVGVEEFKADEYEIGKDLAKAGVSTKVAQMWVNRYNAQLCINSMALVNNRAEYPLTISAPAAGEYTIGMEPSSMAENQTYVLYLTLNGQPIWNLNYNAYTATLEKGRTDGYGLRLVYNAPEIATGIEETTIENGEQVRKVMIDEKVYILRGGQVYSVDGQLVK